MNLRGKFAPMMGPLNSSAFGLPYPIPMWAGGRDACQRAQLVPRRPHSLDRFGRWLVPVTTHLFVKGDSYLASDAVFGVKDSLIADFVRHDSADAAAQHNVSAPFYTVEHDWVLETSA